MYDFKTTGHTNASTLVGLMAQLCMCHDSKIFTETGFTLNELAPSFSVRGHLGRPPSALLAILAGTGYFFSFSVFSRFETYRGCSKLINYE